MKVTPTAERGGCVEEKTGYHRGTQEKESALCLGGFWNPTFLLSPLLVLSCFNLQLEGGDDAWNCMMKEPSSISSFESVKGTQKTHTHFPLTFSLPPHVSEKHCHSSACLNRAFSFMVCGCFVSNGSRKH